VVVAATGRETEAVMRLGRIGFDHVAGYLENGMAALADRPDLMRRTDRITAATLAEHLASGEPPVVLDVRTPGERQRGSIEGSLHIPLNHLRARAGEVPRDRPVVIHCATGYRSSIGASILEAQGVEGLQDLVGGFSVWKKVVEGEAPA
jgi:rhodanese-related sulfurtransferase